MENATVNTPVSLIKSQKHLAAINVYGKERDTCPLEQAMNGGLHNLAAIVRYHPVETPGPITPSSEADLVTSNNHGQMIYPTR